ncbi:MAG: type IV secretion system protein VirB3 [Candidatus Xenolissoclinum pacificiensis L6]|uniref:Type IV secretion system protein VirB3 n=1 Tax=Candidatus Xenolissoclinum pacificiensis L6 TaxID=1401685 RepID=W2V2A8_9RICK|nr:MAG: type IV secretion system protein VirB3 [Candidatus Xenolissoclinum pacificiensis L6]
MSTGTLETDSLFKGLTRPAMLFGVSFTFTGMNAMLTLSLFIFTKNVFVLVFLLPVIHTIGYVVCFSEPLFMELFIIRNQKCNKCRNVSYHGANSYDMS